MVTLITINDIAMPQPSDYSVSLSDLDSSDTGRSETGYMYRNRIRTKIYKINVGFRVNKSQLKTIADAISGESFQVKFFDPTSVSAKSCTMYAGDLQAQLLKNDDTANETVWSFSFNLIEM